MNYAAINTAQQLRLVYWNANGLRTKRNDLELFARHHGLDVILVNETHLRAGCRANISGYTLHRDDRTDRQGGGTAVYIRSQMKHYKEPTPALERAEATIIVVEQADGERIRIVSFYNPPNRLLLTDDLKALLDSQLPTIMAGDFNAKHQKWNSSRANRNGLELQEFLEKEPYTLHVDAPDTPTFYHNYIPDCQDVLDIALFKNFQGGYAITNLYELSSDHNPVLLVLNLSGSPLAAPIRCRTDWTKFREAVESSISVPVELNGPAELEAAVARFTSEISEAVNANSTPIAPGAEPFVPSAIRQLIRDRNRAKRYWQKYGYPSDKKEANRLDREVKKALAEFRNEQWSSKIASLSTRDNSIWKLAKSLRSKRDTIPPIRRPDGSVAVSPVEKAEAFADGLEEQFTPTDRNADAALIKKLTDETGAALAAATEERLEPTNLAEVNAYIARTKAGKAPGPDEVSARTLKLLPERGVLAFTYIINHVLTLKYFPQCWKEARVILIRKPKTGGTKTADYRPISLLSVLGKICERVVESRLREATERKEIIPKEQHGFRPGHSSVHQLMRVVEKINRGFSLKQHTGAIFLDVAKAFDKVWHVGLLHKLLAREVPLPLCQLLDSYLSKRFFRVRTEGELSGTRQIAAGVPQGSILGPLLFTCYTADIPVPEDRRAQLALYADDTAITFTSTSPELIVSKLQQYIEILERWFSDWRILINPSKSAAVLFTRRRGRRTETPSPVVMFGETIPWVNQTRYLGLIMDKQLTWKPHVDHVRKKAWGGMAALRSIMGRSGKLSLKNKILLYKTMIRPIMTYAAPVWGHARRSTMDKLQIVQNKILREAVNAPWFVRNADIRKDTNVRLIMEFIKELSVKFHKTLPSVPNETISNLCTEDDPYGNPHPRDILRYEPP